MRRQQVPRRPKTDFRFPGFKYLLEWASIIYLSGCAIWDVAPLVCWTEFSIDEELMILPEESDVAAELFLKSKQ